VDATEPAVLPQRYGHERRQQRDTESQRGQRPPRQRVADRRRREEQHVTRVEGDRQSRDEAGKHRMGALPAVDADEGEIRRNEHAHRGGELAEAGETKRVRQHPLHVDAVIAASEQRMYGERQHDPDRGGEVAEAAPADAARDAVDGEQRQR
jgi:hypothetical protein